jgi:hypothetical protein
MQPVLSVKVALVNGGEIEVTTEGQVIVAPPRPRAPLGAVPPPLRAVRVQGAPGGARPGNVLCHGLLFRTVTPSGAVVAAYDDGHLRVVHPDGCVSERTPPLAGWVAPSVHSINRILDSNGNSAEVPARGWIRTLADGTRIREPDEGSVRPAPPLPPPTPLPNEEPADAKKKAAAGGKPKQKSKVLIWCCVV